MGAAKSPSRGQARAEDIGLRTRVASEALIRNGLNPLLVGRQFHAERMEAMLARGDEESAKAEEMAVLALERLYREALAQLKFILAPSGERLQ